MKLKKGDQIIVTVGKDKGKKGKVEKVFPKDATVVVPGINIVKKHEKKRDEQHPGGAVAGHRPEPPPSRDGGAVAAPLVRPMPPTCRRWSAS